MTSSLLIPIFMSGIFHNSQKQSREVTAEDLKPEYDLIMQKKSKLSSMQRKIVVAKYSRLTVVST